MTSGVSSLRSTLIDTLIRVRRPDVPVLVALRNTAVVIVPLVAGFASGHVVAGVGVSVGALNVMFADQPGPYRQRLQVIALVTLAAALSGLVGFLVGEHMGPSIAAVALWGFLGGMLVLFGPNMARVGLTSMILLVVATSTPLPWRPALAASGLILAGGIGQALFAIVAWPLQRYRPERLALATVYRDLGQLARRQPGDEDAPPVTETLTSLQQTLLGRAHGRGRAMEAFHTLLELADRMRLEWMALSEASTGTAAQAMFRYDAARVLEAVADALAKGEPPAAAERALKTLEAAGKTLDGSAPRHCSGSLRHMHALTGQLGAAVRNANWAGSRGEIRARAADTALPRALRSVAPVAALRANLNLSSAAFRHALRCAVVLALAMALAHVTDLGRGYWLPMTAAIVLRPNFGATLNVGLLRVLGTLLGLVLTTVLLRLTPGSVWADLALMAVLCFSFRYLAGAHYGIAVAALTGTVVILLSFVGVGSSGALVERVINTALGSALALVAYIVWPTWERGRARAALADMLATYAHYLRSVTSGSDEHDRRDTRAAARAARSNAQASLERLRVEPATTPEMMQLAITLIAGSNRLVRTSMALEALLDDNDGVSCPDAVDDFLEAASDATQRIADAVRDVRAPDDLPPVRDLQHVLAERLRDTPGFDDRQSLIALSDRLADNIDTLAHALGRTDQVA